MYMVGKLHPDLPEANEPGYTQGWLSEQDKRDVIDRFYSDERHTIPLSLDHRNSGKYGFIPHGDVIGDVLDLFTDRNGDLMVKTRLSPQHPAYGEVNRGMTDRAQKWGFSVGLLPGDGGGEKTLMHVALTPEPGFAAYDTYIKHWHLNEDRLNAIIARELYMPGEGGRAYAAPEFDEKLKRMSIFIPLLVSNVRGSQSSRIVRIMSETTPLETAPQQATVTERMEISTPQAPPPAPFNRRYVPTQFDVDDVEAIDAEIMRMKEHVDLCTKNGISYLDLIEECPQFDADYRKYKEKSQQMNQEFNDHFSRVVKAAKKPEQLQEWRRIIDSRSPDTFASAQRAKGIQAANMLLFKQAEEEHRKKEAQWSSENEELKSLKRRLEEENKSLHERFAHEDKRHRVMSADEKKLSQLALPGPSTTSSGSEVSLIDALGTVHGKRQLGSEKFQRAFQIGQIGDVPADFGATPALRKAQDLVSLLQRDQDRQYY